MGWLEVIFLVHHGPIQGFYALAAPAKRLATSWMHWLNAEISWQWGEVTGDEQIKSLVKASEGTLIVWTKHIGANMVGKHDIGMNKHKTFK